jgi:glucose/arabinose dehydrogenase
VPTATLAARRGRLHARTATRRGRVHVPPGLALAATAGLALLISPSATATAAAAVRTRLVEVGRFAQPLYVTAPPGDPSRLFVVERGGDIRVLVDGRRRPRPFLRVPGVSTRNAEQGLLSMAFAPDYATSGRLYVVFTDRRKDLELLEYRRSPTDPDLADASSERTVLLIRKTLPTHNAGQLQFGPDGLLYLSVGDGGCCGDRNDDAQRLDTLFGKILRIDPRRTGSRAYSVPRSNPFVGRRGARPEVYAYGLRNPYRFSFDRATGALAIGDVGDVAPDGDEEVDWLARGKARGANFGWNVFEGRRRFRAGGAPGAVRPVLTYSRRGAPCAVIGGYVVRDHGDRALEGRYVFGDSCSGRLTSALLHAGGARDVRPLARTVSPSSFGEDARGHVYVTSLAGGVYRLAAG